MDLQEALGSNGSEALTRRAGSSLRILTFFVRDLELAVPLDRLREIVSFTSVTRVPRTPSWLLGVTNLRGDVLPLVDLAGRLGLPAAVTTSRSCYAVMEIRLRGRTMGIGLVMDRVGRIADVAEGAFAPLPPGGVLTSSYLREALVLGEDTVFRLEPERLFEEAALVALGLMRPGEPTPVDDPPEVADPAPVTDADLEAGGIHLFDD